MARAHWSVIGIFLILAVHTLQWAVSFLVPITAAMLGFLVALPLEKRMSRIGIPSFVTALVVTLGLAIVLGFVLFAIAMPFTDLLAQLPEMVDQLRHDLSGMGEGPINTIREAADAAQEAVEGDTAAAPPIEVKVADEGGGVITKIASKAPSIGGQLVLTLVLMFFLISSGSMFLQKLVAALNRFEDKRRAVKVVREVAEKLGSYLAGITIINAGLGVCIGAAMYLLGVPNALMFGFVAFAFNFVPYIGAVGGAALAAIVSYSENPDLGWSMIVFGCYMALTSFEGQFVTPYLISGRLKLNPPVVFIAVAFFAWIWSITGMVVAVPILIAAKIILDHNPSTRALGMFLAESGTEGEIQH